MSGHNDDNVSLFYIPIKGTSVKSIEWMEYRPVDQLNSGGALEIKFRIVNDPAPPPPPPPQLPETPPIKVVVREQAVDQAKSKTSSKRKRLLLALKKRRKSRQNASIKKKKKQKGPIRMQERGSLNLKNAEVHQKTNSLLRDVNRNTSN